MTADCTLMCAICNQFPSCVVSVCPRILNPVRLLLILPATEHFKIVKAGGKKYHEVSVSDCSAREATVAAF